MNTAFKVASLAGGVGGIAGGGILVHELSKDEGSTIRGLFSKSQTKILLSLDSESEEWKKAWNSYKTKNPWNLKNTNSEETTQEFKDKCSSLLNEKVSGEDSDTYSQFVLYCSRDKAVKDILKGKGYSLARKEGNESFWQGQFDKYKAADENKKIPNINIGKDEKHNESNNLDKLKSGCTDAFNKPVTDASYMDVLENIREWCSSKDS
ncbi:hypothetical protein HF1_08500 [Mycoplasma haemofelis str. Langford 1]|uniref:Uncharacterized protein n=2 Tax=Mycoplasma haemofelis TaxID=29501 RepID=F6FIY9_MYCHI|nr:hypothetical protein [Mycoplasma haemofelis]AEG73187.1 hypothetical protein MHF_0930 [Mycoplasma haemofelis Ohio2]CBY92858.1 hypothetical protein HF1_08500 [Mycoplasma haemofelis str. Langford 1]